MLISILGEKAIPLFENLIGVVMGFEDADHRIQSFMYIFGDLPLAALKEKAIPIYEKLIFWSETIEDPETRSFVYVVIGNALVKDKFAELAATIFDKSIVAAEGIKKEFNRKNALYSIVYSLSEVKLSERAIPLFEKLIAASAGMRDAFEVRVMIARALASEALKEKAIPLYEKLLGWNPRSISNDSTLPNKKEEATLLYEKFIVDAYGFVGPEFRWFARSTLAVYLAATEGKEAAFRNFKVAIEEAEQITAPEYRLKAIKYIARSVTKAGLTGRVSIPKK